MPFRLRSLFLLLWLLPLAAEEEIIVQVATQARMTPVYVAPWISHSPDDALTSAHLKELLKTLLFDLEHNGRTKVVANTPERDNRARRDRALPFPETDVWKGFGIHYLVQGDVTGNELMVTLDSIVRGQQMGSYRVPLSGDSHTDRAAIHQLADTLHAALFGTLGIASSHLLYTVRSKRSDGEGWNSQVWCCDYDGAYTHQITREHRYAVTPSYLPPEKGKISQHFFFSSYPPLHPAPTGQPKLYTASLHDGTLQRLTQLRGSQFMPVCSPQRNLIAFISDAAGNPDLFIQRFDPGCGLIGKPKQLYTAPRGSQGSPTFSPDGNRIAFVSNKDGAERIYLVDIPPEEDRSSPIAHLVSRRTRGNTAPSWSPDGTKIAYSALTEGTRQIWYYDLCNGEEVQVTSGPGHKENPSWAPDSFHLVLSSGSTEHSELYLINLNQPKAVRLTRGPGSKRFPCWEPRPR